MLPDGPGRDWLGCSRLSPVATLVGKANSMSITAARKKEVIADNQRSSNDSGSPEVQVAILTSRIQALTEHLKEHRHDYSSQRGLLQMVSRRRRLLTYLQRKDRPGYQALITKLGLRR